jgi:hypothetical protein
LTNRNFFLYLQARFPSAVPDGQSAFAQPYRIVRGAGDGAFEIIYGGIAESEEWLYGENVLDAILQNGAHAERIFLPFSQVVGQPVYVFEYAFDMCAEMFAQALGRNADLLLNAGVTSFRSVAIQPPNNDSALRVFFMESPQRIFEFNLQPTRRISSEDFRTEVSPVNLNGKHFIATHRGFLPNIPRGGFAYHAINVENPFRDPQGLFRISHIRSMVEPFFDNPAAIIPTVSADNVYTFSTRNTMVRYLENAVFEYTSYRTVGRTAPSNFMANFSAALDFVTNDPHVASAQTEIFLRNHDTRGRAHIFWFDYAIDNRPLVLTREWHTGAHCNDPLLAPIEIIVDHGRVVRYRRLAYTFSTGALSWKNSHEFDFAGHFSLGFPISEGPTIDLTIFIDE